MVSVIRYSPNFHIVNLLKRFGTSFEIFMKEIQKSKLQTYRGQFEQLKMKEDEDITTYFLRVDETVNANHRIGRRNQRIYNCSKGTKISSYEIQP